MIKNYNWFKMGSKTMLSMKHVFVRILIIMNIVYFVIVKYYKPREFLMLTFIYYLCTIVEVGTV